MSRVKNGDVLFERFKPNRRFPVVIVRKQVVRHVVGTSGFSCVNEVDGDRRPDLVVDGVEGRLGSLRSNVAERSVGASYGHDLKVPSLRVRTCESQC